jgi:hypothetical protein
MAFGSSDGCATIMRQPAEHLCLATTAGILASANHASGTIFLQTSSRLRRNGVAALPDNDILERSAFAVACGCLTHYFYITGWRQASPRRRCA